MTTWEGPESLWRRLKLGREEYLQRLITTLIVGGDPPSWNTRCSPIVEGGRFLRLLDDLAHDDVRIPASPAPDAFVDEYLLPKVEEDARNGWPDWAVSWSDRIWVIELKTEAASHRDDQLPYYLRLATAAHPDCRVDLTYITGPLTKPGPPLLPGQRYSHLTWDQVLPLVEAAWDEVRPEVLRAKPAIEWFETAGRHLLAAGERAGVRHHVALSIVGCDRVDLGY